MNYIEYLKETVIQMELLSNGRTVNFIMDRNVTFIVSNGYWIFMVGSGQNVRCTVLKDKKIILDFFAKTDNDDYTHMYLVSLLEAAVDCIMNGQEMSLSYGEATFGFMVKTNTIKDINIIYNIAKNCDYSTGTGRVFFDDKAVSMRGKKVDAITIQNNYNRVARELGTAEIRDDWEFEYEDEVTGQILQMFYKDIKKPQKKKKLDNKLEFNSGNKTMGNQNKIENPAPNLIMDKDWNNAIRVLGSGFTGTIETARRKMDDYEFENFIKGQLPRIHKASLQLGEGNEL